MEPLNRTLVHFSHALKFEDLSGDIAHQTKCLLVDYLGVTIAGTRTESAQAVCRMVLNDTYNLGPGRCTIIGTSARSSPERAALANGTASHSIELDDTHQAGSIQLGTLKLFLVFDLFLTAFSRTAEVH
jgi:2-methylcitrate dehydratase PrpD